MHQMMTKTDVNFLKMFREWFIDFSDGLDICSEVWDYFKGNIKTFCIKYCKEKKK
jgi:hypothetical protein